MTRTLVDVLSLPPEAQHDDELTQLVRDAIVEGLSDLESASMLAYLQGLSYVNIAAQLGVSSKSCDNALQRARRKSEINLRSTVTQYYVALSMMGA